jgi:hypothetical protein
MSETKLPRILSKEDLAGYSNNLTVGDLKKFIEKHNLPDDAKVMIQRVEDKYFEKNDWGVYLKEGYWYHTASQLNENMKAEAQRRELGMEPEYSVKDPWSQVVEIDDTLKEQYHPAWGCVRYGDDTDLLFIDLHY